MNEKKNGNKNPKKDLIETLKFLEAQLNEERTVFQEKLIEKEKELNAIKVRFKKTETELKTEIAQEHQEKSLAISEFQNELKETRKVLEEERIRWQDKRDKEKAENADLNEEIKKLKAKRKKETVDYKIELKVISKEFHNIKKNFDEKVFSYEEKIENLKAETTQSVAELKHEYDLMKKETEEKINTEFKGEINILKNQLEEEKVAREEMLIVKNEEMGNTELAFAQKEIEVKKEYERKERGLKEKNQVLEEHLKELGKEMALQVAYSEDRLKEKDSDILHLQKVNAELLNDEEGLKSEIVEENVEIEELEKEIESERKKLEEKILYRDKEINELKRELENKEEHKKEDSETYEKKEKEIKRLLEDELLKVQVRLRNSRQNGEVLVEKSSASIEEKQDKQESEETSTKESEETSTKESEESAEPQEDERKLEKEMPGDNNNNEGQVAEKPENGEGGINEK